MLEIEIVQFYFYYNDTKRTKLQSVLHVMGYFIESHHLAFSITHRTTYKNTLFQRWSCPKGSCVFTVNQYLKFLCFCLKSCNELFFCLSGFDVLSSQNASVTPSLEHIKSSKNYVTAGIKTQQHI